jgi:hypothetical protein
MKPKQAYLRPPKKATIYFVVHFKGEGAGMAALQLFKTVSIPALQSTARN